MRKYMDLINEAEIDPSATPPEREEKDKEHYDALNKTGFFGSQAAGCVLMAKSTGRIMLVLRSQGVLEPHTWGNLGGAHAADERPIDAAKREAYEETGYTGSVTMIPLMVFKKGNFRYSNFLGIVDEEFEPHLGWEADDHVWVSLGRFPRPLHFGMESLFADDASIRTLRHYASMFANGDELHEDVDLDQAIATAKEQISDVMAGGDFDPNKPDAEVEAEPTDDEEAPETTASEKKSLAAIGSKGSV